MQKMSTWVGCKEEQGDHDTGINAMHIMVGVAPTIANIHISCTLNVCVGCISTDCWLQKANDTLAPEGRGRGTRPCPAAPRG